MNSSVRLQGGPLKLKQKAILAVYHYELLQITSNWFKLLSASVSEGHKFLLWIALNCFNHFELIQSNLKWFTARIDSSLCKFICKAPRRPSETEAESNLNQIQVTQINSHKNLWPSETEAEELILHFANSFVRIKNGPLKLKQKVIRINSKWFKAIISRKGFMFHKACNIIDLLISIHAWK